MENYLRMKEVVSLMGRKDHETRQSAFVKDKLNYRVGQT